jgi:hypothetical protein
MPEMTTPVSYGKHFVAFIDLLGQREQVTKLAALPPAPEFREQILNRLIEMFRAFRTFRLQGVCHGAVFHPRQ